MECKPIAEVESMPTYNYRCENCNDIFEVFHSINCTDPQLCPKCGSVGKKLLSASSIIFKGSGFYTTDYRDSSYIEAQKRESDLAKNSNTASSPSSTSNTSSSNTSNTNNKSNNSSASSNSSNNSITQSRSNVVSTASSINRISYNSEPTACAA